VGGTEKLLLRSHAGSKRTRGCGIGFAGEEFPEPGIVGRLRERGHELDADGPSYLIHLYEDDPIAFPSGLNGRFQGLLTDQARATATLFNDRYGMHRIYYHEAKEAFYFSAEAKPSWRFAPNSG